MLFAQLAKKYHPDTNKDDPKAKEKFSQLAEAYEVVHFSLASCTWEGDSELVVEPSGSSQLASCRVERKTLAMMRSVL